MLFGYTLVNAFPNTFLSGAMDMEWPKGSTQPFVLQGGGHIVRLLGNGQRKVCLDFDKGMEDLVAQRGEGGALGMALHPKFNDATDPKPYVYVWFNYENWPRDDAGVRLPGAPVVNTHQRLVRWTFDPATNTFDPASEFILVDSTEKQVVHNGARVKFGPDGFLYWGVGDDQRPQETAQRLDYGLFSGLFRIDVDMQGGSVSHPPPRQPTDAVTQGYYIPNDNPFVGAPNAVEEFYALGFRNPYSFSFDRMTGDIWLGDVGDTWREEINKIEKGGNYAWPIYEGLKQRTSGSITLGTLKQPVYDYTHHAIGDLTAIMMGYVYRGTKMPELIGKVIYSDWPTGRIWALDPATAKRQSLFEWNTMFNAPVGFGQDADGEVYVIAWGRIFRLERATAPHTVPLKLSQTGIFSDVAKAEVSSAFVPYEIRSSLWSDGAAKKRFVFIPPGQRASVNADGGVMQMPPGSVLVKQFDLPASAQPVNGRSKRLETRVLVIGDSETYGVTYKWNRDGTDGDLVLEGHDEDIQDMNPLETRAWHYPSSGECWGCHRQENRVLGFRDFQLNFNLANNSNQLAALGTAGMFDMTTMQYARPAIADPTDTNATPEARAMAYVAANCSGCHNQHSAYLGGVSWNASPGVAMQDRGLLGAPHHNYPMAGAFNLLAAPLVKSGDPMGSILRARINSADPDLMMPPVGRRRVDPLAVQVIDAWVSSLPP